MIGIHPIHRRLAQIQFKAEVVGYDQLTQEDQVELRHCLIVNGQLVRRLDELKQLSFIAYTVDDRDWQHEICKQIEELEAKMI
ncbi:hypothetical protein [Paenibacillus sp. GCM10012303]|uniref:DUF7667 family protein n=1 Tax=Paenibacillus sp. GCM10012303 TaxID=3317340 RepID=UPI00361170C3